MPGPPKYAQSGTESDTPGERVYMDGDGARWRVFEQPFANYDRRTGLSLIFSSDSAVRRVRNYPADWMNLSDVDLAALSWKS